MRKRINNSKLVASTNPETKSIINKITGRATRPEKVITIGERTGLSSRAILECKKVISNTTINTKSFNCKKPQLC